MEGTQWVGQSTVTGAHFSPCIWLGLWLLGVQFVISLGLLSAVPNLDTTVGVTQIGCTLLTMCLDALYRSFYLTDGRFVNMSI